MAQLEGQSPRRLRPSAAKIPFILTSQPQPDAAGQGPGPARAHPVPPGAATPFKPSRIDPLNREPTAKPGPTAPFKPSRIDPLNREPTTKPSSTAPRVATRTAPIAQHRAQGDPVKQARSGALPLDPTRGRCPLDSRQGRALGTRSLAAVREGRCVAGLGCPDQGGDCRRDPGNPDRPRNAPPSPQPNEWIPKAPPLVGVQGARPPGGFQGSALTLLPSPKHRALTPPVPHASMAA